MKKQNMDHARLPVLSLVNAEEMKEGESCA